MSDSTYQTYLARVESADTTTGVCRVVISSALARGQVAVNGDSLPKVDGSYVTPPEGSLTFVLANHDFSKVEWGFDPVSKLYTDASVAAILDGSVFDGDVSFGGNITMSQTLEVTGLTTLGDLDVTDIDATTVDVSGTTTLTDLVVTGSTTLLGTGLDGTYAQVAGDTFTGDVTVDANFTVNDAANFLGATTVVSAGNPTFTVRSTSGGNPRIRWDNDGNVADSRMWMAEVTLSGGWTLAHRTDTDSLKYQYIAATPTGILDMQGSASVLVPDATADGQALAMGQSNTVLNGLLSTADITIEDNLVLESSTATVRLSQADGTPVHRIYKLPDADDRFRMRDDLSAVTFFEFAPSTNTVSFPEVTNLEVDASPTASNHALRLAEMTAHEAAPDPHPQYVLVTGDSMSGNLTMTGGADLILNGGVIQSVSNQNTDSVTMGMTGIGSSRFILVPYPSGTPDFTKEFMFDFTDSKWKSETPLGVADPTADGDALNRITGDGRYVNVTGDTMTGDLSMATGAQLKFAQEIGDKIVLYDDGVGDSYTIGMADSTLYLDTESSAKVIELQTGGVPRLTVRNTAITASTFVVVPNAAADTHALNRITADGRYVNVTGDTMTGALTVQNDVEIHSTDSQGRMRLKHQGNGATDRFYMAPYSASTYHFDREFGYSNQTEQWYSDTPLTVAEPQVDTDAATMLYVNSQVIAANTLITNHIGDTDGAHAGSAISYDNSTLTALTQAWLTGDDVQTAVTQLAAQIEAPDASTIEAILSALNALGDPDNPLDNPDIFNTGVILADAIAAGQIIASKIAANVINASHIEAYSFTGSEFSASSKIVVGEAGKIVIQGGDNALTTSITASASQPAKAYEDYLAELAGSYTTLSMPLDGDLMYREDPMAWFAPGPGIYSGGLNAAGDVDLGGWSNFVMGTWSAATRSIVVEIDGTLPPPALASDTTASGRIVTGNVLLQHTANVPGGVYTNINAAVRMEGGFIYTGTSAAVEVPPGRHTYRVSWDAVSAEVSLFVRLEGADAWTQLGTATSTAGDTPYSVAPTLLSSGQANGLAHRVSTHRVSGWVDGILVTEFTEADITNTPRGVGTLTPSTGTSVTLKRPSSINHDGSKVIQGNGRWTFVENQYNGTTDPYLDSDWGDLTQTPNQPYPRKALATSQSLFTNDALVDASYSVVNFAMVLYIPETFDTLNLPVGLFSKGADTHHHALYLDANYALTFQAKTGGVTTQSTSYELPGPGIYTVGVRWDDAVNKRAELFVNGRNMGHFYNEVSYTNGSDDPTLGGFHVNLTDPSVSDIDGTGILLSEFFYSIDAGLYNTHPDFHFFYHKYLFDGFATGDGFHLDASGRFSAGTGLSWDGYRYLSVGDALQWDDRLGILTIGSSTTGSKIESGNFTYTSGNFSDTGTKIDLVTGEFFSPEMAITNSGFAQFKGELVAPSGDIGGWTINPTDLSSPSSNIVLDNANSRIKVGSDPSFDIEIQGSATSTTSFIKGGSVGDWNTNNGFYFDAAGRAQIGNAAADYILYTGSNLQIDTPNFSIDAVGNTTMSGTVTATAGFIGGWDIDATALSSTNDRVFLDSSGDGQIRVGPVGAALNLTGASLNTAAALHTQGATWANTTGIWLDASGRLRLGAGLYWDGATLTIDGDGTFTGDITGSSGTFSDTVSGASIVGGTIDIGSGTFTVDGSGNLVATSATITGAVTATSGSFTGSLTSTTGTIGGWSLGASTLTGGSMTLNSSGNLSAGTVNDIVRVSADDATYRLWVGNATASSAPFRVTKAGAVTMTNAVITGSSVSGYATTTQLNTTNSNVTDAQNAADAAQSGVDVINTAAGAQSIVSSWNTTPGATTIDGDNIRTGSIASTSYTGVTDGSAYSTTGTNISLDDGSITSKNFRITSAGDAFFAGDISGAAGTFTGNLSGSTITGGSITGGSINIGTGTFQVNSSGDLTATSATISGAVTASSGSIGGLTVGPTSFYSGTGTWGNDNTPFFVGSNGDFSLGDSFRWNEATSTLDLATLRLWNTSSGTLQAEWATATGAQDDNVLKFINRETGGGYSSFEWNSKERALLHSFGTETGSGWAEYEADVSGQLGNNLQYVGLTFNSGYIQSSLDAIQVQMRPKGYGGTGYTGGTSSSVLTISNADLINVTGCFDFDLNGATLLAPGSISSANRLRLEVSSGAPDIQIGEWTNEGDYAAVETTYGYLLLGRASNQSIYLRTTGTGNVNLGANDISTLVLNASNEAVFAANVRIGSVIDVNPTRTNPPLMVAPYGGANIAMDGNEIMWRDDGTPHRASFSSSDRTSSSTYYLCTGLLTDESYGTHTGNSSGGGNPALSVSLSSFLVPAVHANASAIAGTTLHVAGVGGSIYRYTSSRKVKKNIIEMTLGEARRILDVEWNFFEAIESDDGWQIPGSIAEHFYEIDKRYCTFDMDSDPDHTEPVSINYAAVVAPIGVIQQDHDRLIQELEAKNAELEARLERLEAALA